MTVAGVKNDIKVMSSDQLYNLYEVFAELGFAHRYSAELGEFDIKIGEQWVTFYVDHDVLADEKDAAYWREDADMVADYYGRQ